MPAERGQKGSGQENGSFPKDERGNPGAEQEPGGGEAVQGNRIKEKHAILGDKAILSQLY